MSLDENKKRELRKKIEEQRRSMWKGQMESGRRKRSGRELRETDRVSDQQPQEQNQSTEYNYVVLGDASVVKQTEAKQMRAEREKDQKELARKIKEQRRAVWMGKASSDQREARSRLPRLGLALLIILGLIGAIAIGIGIGYLLAFYDLIGI